jgi:hypothetical protein
MGTVTISTCPLRRKTWQTSVALGVLTFQNDFEKPRHLRRPADREDPRHPQIDNIGLMLLDVSTLGFVH